MNLPGIILVDDHRLFRSGLRYLLESSGKYKVIGEASNGQELMELLENLSPRLIIFDINIPELNGIETTKIALAQYPNLKILIISMMGEKDYYQSLLDCGIKGFIPKDADNEEFFLAIGKILSGETYFAQQLLLYLIREKEPSQQAKFSRREKEILDLISHGLSNHEIAAKLNLSQRTVERHRTHLLEKTGSRNSIRLVIYALKNNLISI
jgi:DNA-binding NarL/FixJ family response regulator